MKVKALILVILTVVMASCSHNAGDIGPLFGEWSLKSVTIDGEVDPGIDCSRYFWRFQGDIVNLTVTGPYQQSSNHFGRWEILDNVLYLDYTAQCTPPNAEFMPPSGIGIEKDTVTPLRIITLNHKEMVLSNAAEDGKTIVYRLRKLN